MSDTSATTGQIPGSGNQFVNAATSQSGNVFIQKALAQQGDTYKYGFEIQDLTEADPDTFDCAELVQWAAKQAGVEITDGSWLQYRHVNNGGGAMSVEEALRTPGALLFSFSSDPMVGDRPGSAHVAISLGDGRTIEARSTKYGVGIFDATNREWTHAGTIPELDDVSLPISPVVEPIQRDLIHGDTDGDGLLDEFELALGTDPFNPDTDGDGFIDSVELVDYGTKADDAASNARSAAMEAHGLEPIMPKPPAVPSIAELASSSGFVAPPDEPAPQPAPAAETADPDGPPPEPSDPIGANEPPDPTTSSESSENAEGAAPPQDPDAVPPPAEEEGQPPPGDETSGPDDGGDGAPPPDGDPPGGDPAPDDPLRVGPPPDLDPAPQLLNPLEADPIEVDGGGDNLLEHTVHDDGADS